MFILSMSSQGEVECGTAPLIECLNIVLHGILYLVRVYNSCVASWALAPPPFLFDSNTSFFGPARYGQDYQHPRPAEPAWGAGSVNVRRGHEYARRQLSQFPPFSRNFYGPAPACRQRMLAATSSVPSYTGSQCEISSFTILRAPLRPSEPDEAPQTDSS